MEPILTREQIRQIDRLAIEELGIPGVVLMENAGRNAADRIARRSAEIGARRVVIFCGPGNNGGDGFVIARQLFNRSVAVTVYLAGDPARLSPDCATNHNIVKNMGLEVRQIDSPETAAQATADLDDGDVVVDALLGTGFSGEVRSPLDVLINGINEAAKTLTVAIDVPSGLDCNTGRPSNATARADLTVTFAANKIGFTKPEAKSYVGRVTVCDIGAPPSLIDRLR
jgi:NAD(P)H-hydrate epimerase